MCYRDYLSKKVNVTSTITGTAEVRSVFVREGGAQQGQGRVLEGVVLQADQGTPRPLQRVHGRVPHLHLARDRRAG